MFLSLITSSPVHLASCTRFARHIPNTYTICAGIKSQKSDLPVDKINSLLIACRLGIGSTLRVSGASRLGRPDPGL